MIRNKVNILFISVCLLIGACGGYGEFKNSATQNYSKEKLQKFSKYMIQGKSLYTTYCSNCHQVDGSGLGKLYPPLKGSDYLVKNRTATICGIKNGLKGEIFVNGIAYDQEMPANSELSNLEIAEIVTYIYNSWGSEEGLITTTVVGENLNNCN